jgi:hypothetical protein
MGRKVTEQKDFLDAAKEQYQSKEAFYTYDSESKAKYLYIPVPFENILCYEYISFGQSSDLHSEITIRQSQDKDDFKI